MSLSSEFSRFQVDTGRWVRPAQQPTARPSPAFGTLTLTAVLIVVILVEMAVSTTRVRMIIEGFGLRSAFWSWTDPSSYGRILTYPLLHSNASHFFWNAVLLLLVGSLIERKIGLRAIGIVFVAGAAVTALTHLLLFPSEARPLIGASGVVSTLFGVAVVIAGGVGLRVRAPWSTRWVSLTVRRLMLFWVGIQAFELASLYIVPGGSIHVAYWMHLAGFAVGVACGIVYQLLGVPARDPEPDTMLSSTFASAGD